MLVPVLKTQADIDEHCQNWIDGFRSRLEYYKARGEMSKKEIELMESYIEIDLHKWAKNNTPENFKQYPDKSRFERKH